MDLPIPFPFKPMLAKAAEGMPEGDWLFEPKWDGYRCIVFRDGDEIELGSRNEKPLTRYFPEILEPLKAALPPRCVVDGEIVVAVDDRLNFDALGQRIHPAKTRVDMLSEKTPADFVAFDLLAVGHQTLLELPFEERRKFLERSVTPGPRVHVTPVTGDRDVAKDWFRTVEGAGLDGLIAKRANSTYESNKRVLIKLKHQRTADCVAVGFRLHKDGNGIGSIILGIYTEEGDLRHVGVSSSFTAKFRSELLADLTPFIEDDFSAHPWASWWKEQAHEDAAEGPGSAMPGAPNRWNNQRDQSWVPLRVERVVEVGYTIMTSGRFRGTTRFVRWRPDKSTDECRYDQLEEVPAMAFEAVLKPPESP